jgi:hypothetical protein
MDGEDLRLAVYLTFAETGRAPDSSEPAGQFAVDVFCSEDCVSDWLAATGSARG